jgi:hypothetical protein
VSFSGFWEQKAIVLYTYSFVINVSIFNQIKAFFRLITQLFLFRSVLGERIAARYTYWAVRISEINASNNFRLCRQISSNQRILHVITFISTLPSKMMQAA